MMNEKKYYVIEIKDVGPNAKPLNEEYVIQNKPGCTNMSHETLENGWLGTTNDIAEYAHGVYDTIEEARAKIKELCPRAKEIILEPYDVLPEVSGYPEKLEVYRDLREVWTVDEWFSDDPPEITADMSDEKLLEIANKERIYIDEDEIYMEGDIFDYFVELREENT